MQERLPTLLVSPLPHEILSPHITLHLFPSTHPHLPTVSGRLAYIAALWTAPVAWGKVPVVGNVRLVILSERMVRTGSGNSSVPPSMRGEKLVVKWRTAGKNAGTTGSTLSAASPTSPDSSGEFTGLFLFEFDEHGRILTHTIEHVEEGGNYERMPRVISVTDWLLGKAWGGRPYTDNVPGLALGYARHSDGAGAGARRGGPRKQSASLGS